MIDSISEIKNRKEILEEAIARLLMNFYNDTGIYPEDIEIEPIKEHQCKGMDIISCNVLVNIKNPLL